MQHVQLWTQLPFKPWKPEDKNTKACATTIPTSWVDANVDFMLFWHGLQREELCMAESRQNRGEPQHTSLNCLKVRVRNMWEPTVSCKWTTSTVYLQCAGEPQSPTSSMCPTESTSRHIFSPKINMSQSQTQTWLIQEQRWGYGTLLARFKEGINTHFHT